ncbi:MAG: LysM peptidoglycan-binding domain-containing protein, partial [Gallionella sp.]|nr:LysM peptidoglycan-binding domain-containing protein [Gallionella sp.]
MRKIISLICFLLPVLACADQLQIRPDAGTGASPDVSLDAPPKVIPEVRSDAPDQYTVVRGDTLWDISGKFFKDPWKWPYIWGLNKDTIKDPHWIYPGDVVRLDRASGTLRIGQVDAGKPAVADATDARRDTSGSGDAGDTIRLSPKVHIAPSAHDAIPSIPANVLGPFLSQPLVIEEDSLKGAPEMIGAREGRVVLGGHDIAFATGLIPDMGDKWQIYRPGKKLVDPETEEMLGIEAVY